MEFLAENGNATEHRFPGVLDGENHGAVWSQDESAPSGRLYPLSRARVPVCMKSGHISDCEREDEACLCPLLEADQFFYSHGKSTNSLSSSAKAEAGRRLKVAGERDKAKSKFSIRSSRHTRGHNFLNSVRRKNEELSAAEGSLLHGVKHEISRHSMTELLEQLQQENEESLECRDQSSNAVFIEKSGPRYSMSILLEDLEKGSPFKWPPKVTKAKKVGRRSSSNLGNISYNHEDAPESLDSSPSSEDVGGDDMVPATVNTKNQTMTDIIQEVFNISALDFEVPFTTKTGIGYYGRLQQILQRDKDGHLEFLKQFYNDKSKGMNVKILSRLLDAKLTVCQCLVDDKIMPPKSESIPKSCEETGETSTRTIVFSSKICREVELGVGGFVCIYPPWKEVKVGEDSIILCTYFSPVTP